MFRVRTDHETGDVLDKEKRRLMPVAGLDEVRDFFRRLGVDDSPKPRRSILQANHSTMVCDHANLYTANSSMPRNHLLSKVSLKLVQVAFIEYALKHLPH